MAMITMASVLLATAGAIGPAASPLQAGTSAPPAVNPVVTPFRDILAHPGPEVRGTDEWARIHAGLVIKNWSIVRGDAQALVERFPASADALAALAAGQAGLGENAAAAATLAKAAELRPGSAPIWLMLAQVEQAIGDREAAAAALERASALRPDDLQGLLSFGRAAIDAGDDTRAASAYERAVRVAPDNPMAWHGWAFAASRLGRLETVWVAFNQLRTVQPGTAEAIASQLPASLRAALPTPIPPTPRPTPGKEVPHFVMGAASGGGDQGGAGRLKVWDQATLGFDASIAALAQRAVPLIEMIRSYEAKCRGRFTISGADTSPAGAPQPETPAEAPGPGRVEDVATIDWTTILEKSSSWKEASGPDVMPECTRLASEIYDLASTIRTAVEDACRAPESARVSAADKRTIRQKYGLSW